MKSHIMLMSLCSLAIVQDLSTGKIKNVFNLGSMAAALICVLITGERTFCQALQGLFAAFLAGVLLWILGAIRAGDAKFLWTVGIIKGLDAFLWTMVYIILSGGIIALCVMLVTGSFKARYQWLWMYIKNIFLTRKYSKYELDNQQEFPFAIPIAIGCLLEYLIRMN